MGRRLTVRGARRWPAGRLVLGDAAAQPPSGDSRLGAVHQALATVLASRSGRFYAATKETAEKVLSVAPPLLELAKRFEEHAKGMLVPCTLFEELGFNYIGPDRRPRPRRLVTTLRNLRASPGPQFLHVVTHKGKGYKRRRGRPDQVPRPAFDPGVGIVEARRRRGRRIRRSSATGFATWRAAGFAASRHHAGDARRLRARGVLAAVSGALLRRRIAEQHAVTFAAGLACEGLQAGGRDLFDLPAARL